MSHFPFTDKQTKTSHRMTKRQSQFHKQHTVEHRPTQSQTLYQTGSNINNSNHDIQSLNLIKKIIRTEKNTEFPKRLPASTEQQSHGSKDSKLSPVLVHVDPINQSNRKFKPQQERTKYPKGKRKKKSKLYIQGKTKNEGKCPIQNIPPLLNSEAPFPPFSIAKTRFTLQNFKQRTMQVKQTTQ